MILTPGFSLRPIWARVAFLALAGARLSAAPAPQETERKYLSGHGPADAVPWEFAVTGGRGAGKWTTIPVPSQWELQGFGTYNYGQEPRQKSSEHGLYRFHFKTPAGWEQRRVRLVFEGAMTDVAVKVNGHLAGPRHQGGFTQFSFDVTRWLNQEGDNLLEVDDAKVSSDPDLEQAERFADYWVFGGIYRPVYLEAVPLESIQHVAVDAQADGSLRAEIALNNVRTAGRIEAQVLNPDGTPQGAPFSAEIPGGGTAQVTVASKLAAPKLWTAETPQLYLLRVTLIEAGRPVHAATVRFGFRTLQVRAGQGLFLNGQRIMLKGVNRHSFRPETGRALTTQDCSDDVRLIKAMNLNAVRMSHYPPDVAFLEACDELGLYVLDELTGWQHADDTAAGRILVRELVERDANHPSILFWDNGNEGGFNRDLDGEFARYDPSHRLVLHPWETFNGIDTKHYPTYADMQQRLKGPNLFFPTEMLHGIYDGGAGAGLEDAWKIMTASPFGAGGFFWVFADEGVVRTDQGRRVDVFSTFAPDGILGPHHEKEGSFYTIKRIFSPVQIETPVLNEQFDGKLKVSNRYAFLGLEGCRLEWKWVKFPGPAEKTDANAVLREGAVAGPAIRPNETGAVTLPLPEEWKQADALSVTAVGPNHEELWTWVWWSELSPTRSGRQPGSGLNADPARRAGDSALHPSIQRDGGSITLRAGGLSVSFDAASALLREIRVGDRLLPLTNGPRLAWARPGVADDTEWLPTEGPPDHVGLTRVVAPHLANAMRITVPKGPAWVGFHLEISPDGEQWKTVFASSRRPGDGDRYEFPPQMVAAIRLSHLHRNDDEPAAIQEFAIGYEAKRFPGPPAAAGAIATGSASDPATGQPSAWVQSSGGDFVSFRWTLLADGALRLDYRYSLKGEFAFHGVTFDLPEDRMRGLRWLGQGPYRVWQNRLPGTWLGVHHLDHNEIQAGEEWDYPESQGYFAALRWGTLETADGPITLTEPGGWSYLRVGTPRINLVKTTPDFPAGDFSLLHAIPAMGSKFHAAVQTGPSGQWAQAAGEYAGSVTFRF